MSFLTSFLRKRRPNALHATRGSGRFDSVRIVALAISVSLNFFCSPSIAQSSPLNSWTLTWTGNPLLQGVYSIAYGNGVFVAVGNGARLVSYDGINWTTFVSPPILNSFFSFTLTNGFYAISPLTPPGIVFGAGMFVAFGTSIEDKANYILKSTNGLTWTPIYTSTNAIFSTNYIIPAKSRYPNSVFAAAYGNNAWVFIAENKIITASITSSNWNWTQFEPGFIPEGVTYGNGVFVICARYLWYPDYYNLILSSPDGITWQYISAPIPPNDASFFGIAYGDGIFVTTAYDPSLGIEVLVSSNLVNWVSSLIQTTNELEFGFVPLAFGGNQFITSCDTNTAFTSSDGFTWVTNSLQSATAFAFGQGAFVASTFGYDIGSVYQSGVFSTDSNSPPTILGISTYPGVTISGTPGAFYQIQATTNLNSTWRPLTNIMLPYSPYIWVDTGSPLFGQRFYRSVQLQ